MSNGENVGRQQKKQFGGFPKWGYPRIKTSTVTCWGPDRPGARGSVEQGCAIIDAEHMYKLPNIRNYNLEVKTGLKAHGPCLKLRHFSNFMPDHHCPPEND